jgi:hypothetical protein
MAEIVSTPTVRGWERVSEGEGGSQGLPTWRVIFSLPAASQTTLQLSPPALLLFMYLLSLINL